MVLVLGVPHSEALVFGCLYPEPMLKLATARGFVEWMVKTGHRFPSDLAGSFNFLGVALLLS
jgi:hypothetical protein